MSGILNLNIMKKHIAFVIVIIASFFGSIAWGASPAFENFKTGVFVRSGNTIQIATGATNASGDMIYTASLTTNLINILATNNLPIFDVTRFGAYPGKPSNTTNIQAAIEAAGAAATEARPAVVYIPRGEYPCDPYETVFGSGRTSEGHQSLLTIWTNNVWIVGDGKNATKLRATRDGPSGVMNFLGAGSSVAATDAYTRYTSNIILAGIEIDADGHEFECTQIFNPVNWLAIDCRMRGAAWRSGNSFDGWDTQGEIGFTFVDCEAVDCSGNGFGVSSGTSTNVFLFNIRAERCGTTTAANGGALQFTQNPPPKVRGLVAKNCGLLVTPGSFFDIEDGIVVVTNTTAKTNIYLASTFGGTLRNVRFDVTPNTAAPLIAVVGGFISLENVKIDNVNWRSIFMSSGSATIKDGSVIGINGTQVAVEATGGTLSLYDSSFYAGTTLRDLRSAATLTARNCRFTGGGVLLNGGSYLLEDSLINYGGLSISASGTVKGCAITSGGLTVNSGTIVFMDNYINTTITRGGGTPLFLAGNVFAANTLANSIELGESRPSPTSITPTASYTLYTNSTPYTVRLHWYGGTLTGYGLNGTQMGTGAGMMLVNPGDWVGITNSDTTGHVIQSTAF